jgi:hypothetical protein
MFGTILKNITVFETVRRRLGLERDNIKDMETLGNVFTGDGFFFNKKHIACTLEFGIVMQ